jgi:hypothetical protein
MQGYMEVVAETGTVRITPKDPEACKARAEEYRAAVSAAQARISRLPGHAAFSEGRWIDGDQYWAIRGACNALSHARGLKSHAGRLKALAAICKPTAAVLL